MKKIPFLALLLLGLLPILHGRNAGQEAGQDAEYAALKAEAEQLFRDGSFELAGRVYAGAEQVGVPEGEEPWVRFRLADCLWRSQAATGTSDDSPFDAARKVFEELIAQGSHEAQPETESELGSDRLVAEAHESLADLHWDRRQAANWGAASPHYLAALESWARSTDLELARERYLAIVWRMTRPTWYEAEWNLGRWGNHVPAQVLRNAVRIAQEANDRARSHYLLARSLERQGGWDARTEVGEALSAVLEIKNDGERTDWYDDALFHYGAWLQNGVPQQNELGHWTAEPDYVRAVATYRRLLDEFERSQTRYWDDAQNRLRDITGPRLDVATTNAFLPGSEAQFQLSWRNVESVRFTLYELDLTQHVDFSEGSDRNAHSWIHEIEAERLEPVRTWTHATGDDGRHVPGWQGLTLDPAPASGAWLLVASGGGLFARTIVMVGDTSLLLKSSGTEVLAWYCSVEDGRPIEGADLALWRRTNASGNYRWVKARSTTNADGIATFELGEDAQSNEIFAAARFGRDQSFALGHTSYRHHAGEQWKAYSFTDRPAYRPKDTVSWKSIVRSHDGSRYETPVGAEVRYRITDPRGTEVGSGTEKLGEFGALWGEFETTEDMALGQYQLQLAVVEANKHSQWVASSPLFRLEEYKLPEFQVSVGVPEEDGVRPLFRVGGEVTARVSAEYYFGGPVANAAVEVVVYQRPYSPAWHREHEYAWFFQNDNAQYGRHWYGPGSVVQQTTETTDSAGHVDITFPTPRGANQDFEYTVEARVTDSSRREVVGQGVVRVTRNAYRARLESEHRLYRPGDAIELTLEARDANDQPVAAQGEVEVVRRRWDAEKEQYDTESVHRTALATNAEGRATLKATAPGEGYYTARWAGRQDVGPRIVAEATVWVCTERTRELGYHQGGVELLVDSETLRVGQKAPVMIATPASGRWVLFTVEREELLSYEVLHVTGDVKLTTLDVNETHVPNLVLTATLLHGGEVHLDAERVIVPPERHFLDVDVVVDRDEVQPGEAGTVEVCVRDHEGRPVQGEIALTLFDESVTAIQADPAGDPRAFFWGEQRPHLVQTTGSSYQLPFVRLERKNDGSFGQRQDHDQAGAGRVTGDDTWFLGHGKKSAGRAAELSRSVASDEMLPASAPAESRESGGGFESGAVPRVRSDFRKTALWLPAIVTDADGCARVDVTYPDSLTRWVGKARVQSAGTDVGIGEVRVRTRMPLMARLQAPRFFQVGDELVVSGVLNNQTAADLGVRADLVASGVTVVGALFQGITIVTTDGFQASVPAGGEARVDWLVRVEEPGEAHLTLSAISGEFADAMERTYPVHERGAEVFLAQTGKFDTDSLEIQLDLPAERRAGSTRVTLDVTPSLAVTMLDALPYLVEYPYGCTEQTLSRFLPAVVVAKTLADQGLSPEIAMQRVFGGIEREHLDQTHPDSKRRRGLDQLDEVTAAGLERLLDFQRGDGGWGWWKDGESDLFMTAYVVWGLSLSRDAGVEVPAGSVERARAFLDARLVEAELQLDLRSWMLHALAVTSGGKTTAPMSRAFDDLWAERARLNAYTRALLALSAHAMGRSDQAHTLVDNLVNGVQLDDSPDTSVVQRGAQNSHPAVQATAHWGEDGIFWRWSQGGVEATATALRALLTIAPDHELVDPVAHWLIRNRRGASWSNTRDTAMVVLALDQYLTTRGELDREASWDVVVNGELVASHSLSGDELIGAPTRLELDPATLVDGRNRIEIVRRGEAPLYFASYATFFSTEEPIPAHGSEVFVRREYFRVVPRATLLSGPSYQRVRMADGDEVRSGERIEVILTLESKNHLEYLLVEDFKPAGLESVELQSGGAFFAHELRADEVDRRFAREAAAPRDASARRSTAGEGRTGRSRWVHREMRDRHNAFFLDRLDEGVWEMRYELRAEIPGTFSAPPVQAHAMYVPEIRANSAEWRMVVRERVR